MKIGITGCRGRVGSLLIKELQSGKWDGLELSYGLSRESVEGLFPITNNVEKLFDHSDCVIDFTLPDAVESHAALAAERGTALIIGTTGLNDMQESALKNAALTAPIVYSSNMSLGVNMLFELVRIAAEKLDPSWDIEIFESHHRHKIDSPSGTAVSLGHAAQKGRGGGKFVHDRAGSRNKGDIGFAVSRGGDVVGEHTVTFYTEGERLELGHRAGNRALFARGALTAAKWIEGKPAGLYSMRDVLGL